MAEQFLFADEPAANEDKDVINPFHILIVDDDEEIHVITKMALADFQLDQRPLAFHSAYSAAEAQAMLQQRDDFALMLLDVVMESDHAGLDVARWTREALKNKLIRIVLRIGEVLQQSDAKRILEELRSRDESVTYYIDNDTYYGLYQTSQKQCYLLFIKGIGELSETDKHLLSLFMNNTAIAFEHAVMLQGNVAR